MASAPDLPTTAAQCLPGETIADSLRRMIRLDIVRGRLEPGAPLRTQVLCDEFDCSMAPLREALSRLASDGLVVAESQRGFRVASVTRAEWRDLIDRRLELETRALSLAVQHGRDAWEGEIARCEHEFALVSQRRAQRRSHIDELWEQRHRALHLALLSGCGSPWLMRFCESLHDHCDRYRRLAKPAPAAMDRLDTGEHELVVAALSRKRQRAVQLMREHIRAIGDAVLANDALWHVYEPDTTPPARWLTATRT
jgi:GntR family carbon starvation induced transcriptional regulator